VDTGLKANIGQRLKAVEHYLAGEEVFLANYSDGLSDVPLEKVLNHFKLHNKVASFISVKPTHSFHVVSMNEDSVINEIQHLSKSNIWINGGYFVLSKKIFEFIKNGEELVEEPFHRLIRERKLITYKYDGFWISMDTFKDKQVLDEMYSRGNAPWEIWKNNGNVHI
jgi:glucose-1-phosphate cytidylyltransferase